MGRIVGLLALVGCSDFAIEKVKDPPIDGERVLVADPELVDFGIRATNAPVTETVTLTATGALPVTLAAVEVSGAAAYAVTLPAPDTVIEPGASLDLVVTYTPASPDDTAAIHVTSDAVSPSLTVPLLGGGTFPAIAISPSSVSFVSEYGEPVNAEITVTSVGTADLSLSDMIVEGYWFSADFDLPRTLAPGESATFTARYTPDVEGETATGKVWLTTNTPAGFAVVPLDAFYGIPCVGLGEAWDRGFLRAETLFDGVTLDVSDASEDTDICIDRWYVYLSDGSQDLGAGDMDADFGDVYPAGSLTVPFGTTRQFGPEAENGPAWWCMEETQYTDRTQTYTFIGAYVPEPLLTSMLAEDQQGVWDWMDANPVMIAARGTNYVEVPPAGGSATVALRVLNMGGEDGAAEVRESVPAGWSAADFSTPPDRTEEGREGATVYVWDVALEAREETGLHEQTIYDERTISYTLTVPRCSGRQYVDEMSTTWTDTDGALRTATANPLVVNCVE